MSLDTLHFICLKKLEMKTACAIYSCTNLWQSSITQTSVHIKAYRTVFEQAKSKVAWQKPGKWENTSDDLGYAFLHKVRIPIKLRAMLRHASVIGIYTLLLVSRVLEATSSYSSLILKANSRKNDSDCEMPYEKCCKEVEG